eukprot:2059708-Amphidinium_carterae.3
MRDIVIQEDCGHRAGIVRDVEHQLSVSENSSDVHKIIGCWLLPISHCCVVLNSLNAPEH